MTEQEFYDSIPEWIAQDKERWNHVTYLAYFCHKYEQKHGVKFRLVRGRSGPARGKEAKDFAKLYKIFAPENYDSLSSEKKKAIRTELTWKIYNYINWMFDYKFRSGERSVNGTRLFHTPAIINEFERMYGPFLKKKKAREGMESLLEWCKKNTPDVLDRHQLERVDDIEMIKKYAEMYSLDAESSEVRLINQAIQMRLVKNVV